MKRRLLIAATCIGASAATSAAPSAEAMMKMSRAVLKVSALGDDDNLSVGSAIVIGPDSALTNCHVTRHARIIVLSRGLARHAVVGQRADVSRDLCLLRTAEPLPYPAVELRPTRSLTLGERVLAHGYSGGMEAHFARGLIVDLHAAGGSHVIQTSAGFLQGASGGGLFDEEGRLIGITTFLTSAGRTEYFAMPADWSERLRERPEDTPKPLTGSALWAQLPAHQPWFMRLLEPLSRKDWPTVAQMAEEWLEAEPHAPAAALMCARAARALARPARMTQCLQQALEGARDSEIELTRIAAWARGEGLSETVETAATALARLRPLPRPD
ncbi:MAG: serine protease [Thauera sp.]|nr:MAG: serine protease [Thauera sp.]